MIDLIIPTLGASTATTHPFICFEHLASFPFPMRLHVVTEGKSWAQAINIGLKQTDGKNDVVLMDDDVFIFEDTFSFLKNKKIFKQADIFGFKLIFPEGRIQHAGGIVRNGGIGHIGFNEPDDQGKYEEPYYVCHATTSLVYIKRHVINELKGMAEDIPGIQMEDVDFSFRALKAGFKILYTPGKAIHLESATKKTFMYFHDGIVKAFNEIKRRHLSDEDFLAKVESYPMPFRQDLAEVC